jgi:hypothetical protein
MDETTEKRDVLNPNAVSTTVKSRKKDVTAYASNPFWGDTHVKIGTKKVTMAGGYLQKNETGETLSMAGVHRIEAVDETQFVKLFTRNMALFFDLNKPAQKLLHFILHVYQDFPGKEGIWWTWRDCEEWIEKHKITGLSRASYHRALAELIHKKLIAESDRTNFYWINAHVFFNGDRMVFIQEYRKERRKAHPKDDNTLEMEQPAKQLEE